ncbi:MAG: ribonuclease J [Coriobacteriia bacterium]|nr:ribonuclease J [Coriobacteriia bacterium]
MEQNDQRQKREGDAAQKKQQNPRSGNEKRRTHSYKHVKLERERPQLTRGNQQQAPANQGQRSKKKKRTAPSDQPLVTCKVIPLGGLDAIGKNMTVFECGNDMIVDDAGLMFPDDDHPGVDLILPDYTYVLENAHKLRGIVITHGHEDHTGTIPYLLKDLDVQVPIYGSKMTLGLIEGKLKEHGIKNAQLVEVNGGQTIQLGRMKVEFFDVNHSIPGALGIFLQTPAGNVLHTGDFKLDQSPIDGVLTDFGALARFGSIGVDLMMSDSTNSVKTSFTPSEAEVGKTLRGIIENAKGRVIIASFASHIHRMQQICDAAVACHRKVVVTGRSMVQNTDIARRLGYLTISDENLIDAYYLKGVPPEQLVIMCTGSQGEPLSALSRIASGEHKTIDIDEGDTVIISATPVPGNEKAVTRIVNMLSKIGADVWDKNRAMVHVSGHAGAEELKLVLSIVQPTYFMPVHGEATHLRAHAKLANATGIAEDHVFILENGESLEISASGVKQGEPVQSGIVYVDGLSVGDTSQEVLDERNALVAQGVAVVSAAVDAAGKRVVGPVSIDMRGITGGDDPYLNRDLEKTVTGALKRAMDSGRSGKDLSKSAKDALLSLLWERTKQKPMTVVHILDV